MRPKEQILTDAYERAADEVCNTDCLAYRKGVCPCAPGEKKKCYRFKYSFDYYVDALIEKECTSDHHVLRCIECDEYHECPFLYQ